ncbi:hypothetical protein SGFS_066430 [Streptomyces graminofaciens]|uniref:Secreted protein n=1 Tax=Streptomyces graminofaciens TaxID=68212 RepID=A0ABN5VPR1_9ACTN|nr:hypothetical protein SGFS_066430 [Streptomyces graminofaciens]
MVRGAAGSGPPVLVVVFVPLAPGSRLPRLSAARLHRCGAVRRERHPIAAALRSPYLSPFSCFSAPVSVRLASRS